MKDLIPFCYHPTRFVFVDDDADYVDMLSKRFEQATQEGVLRASLGKVFLNSLECLRYLNEQIEPSPFIQRCLEMPSSADLSYHSIEVNLSDMYREMYHAKRFEEVTILIADYSMPGMDGLELFSRVQDEYVQKILLTGAADESVAIQAFNDGIIHAYLCKQDPKVFDKLIQTIHEAQWRYFTRLTRILVGTMMKRPKFPIAWRDPIFSQFFKNLFKELKANEFYLFDSVGSFFFLDRFGKSSALFTQNLDQQMAYFLEVQDMPEYFSDEALESLQRHEKIFCFRTDWEKSAERVGEWNRYLRPAKLLNGLNPFHYALVENYQDLPKEKLRTFEQFLKPHQANS